MPITSKKYKNENRTQKIHRNYTSLLYVFLFAHMLTALHTAPSTYTLVYAHWIASKTQIKIPYVCTFLFAIFFSRLLFPFLLKTKMGITEEGEEEESFLISDSCCLIWISVCDYARIYNGLTAGFETPIWNSIS